MIKLTIVSLMTIIFMAELVKPCDKLLMKQMAVMVCGLTKRSLSSDNVWPMLHMGLTRYIEQEFQKLIEDIDEEDLLLNKSDKKKPKDFTQTQKRQSHFSAFLDKMSHKKTPKLLINDNVDKTNIRKRDNIYNLINECCSKNCTIEDFKGICQKK